MPLQMRQFVRHTLVVEIIGRIMREAEPFHDGNGALIVLNGEGYEFIEFAHSEGIITKALPISVT